MSEQRTEALLATIDAHLAEIFRLKAERDELRGALQQIMDARSRTATDVNNAIERARAVLKRTEGKS